MTKRPPDSDETSPDPWPDDSWSIEDEDVAVRELCEKSRLLLRTAMEEIDTFGLEHRVQLQCLVDVALEQVKKWQEPGRAQQSEETEVEFLRRFMAQTWARDAAMKLFAEYAAADLTGNLHAVQTLQRATKEKPSDTERYRKFLLLIEWCAQLYNGELLTTVANADGTFSTPTMSGSGAPNRKADAVREFLSRAASLDPRFIGLDADTNLDVSVAGPRHLPGYAMATVPHDDPDAPPVIAELTALLHNLLPGRTLARLRADGTWYRGLPHIAAKLSTACGAFDHVATKKERAEDGSVRDVEDKKAFDRIKERFEKANPYVSGQPHVFIWPAERNYITWNGPEPRNPSMPKSDLGD